jgi:hypothetical protein
MAAGTYFRNVGETCSRPEGVTSGTVQLRHDVDVNVNKEQGESAAILATAFGVRSLCRGSLASPTVSQSYSVPRGMCQKGTPTSTTPWPIPSKDFPKFIRYESSCQSTPFWQRRKITQTQNECNYSLYTTLFVINQQRHVSAIKRHFQAEYIII